MRTLVMAESFAAPPRAAMYFWISSSAVCAVAGAETRHEDQCPQEKSDE